jgi:hypothetical protein
MHLVIAAVLICGSAAVAGCTAYPGAYAPSGYAGDYGYGYGAEDRAAYASPPVYGYGGTAYIGAPVYGDGGYRWRDHDWDRHGWQNNPAQAERWRQDQQNAPLYRQQVQQNEATYQRQVQDNTARYQQQVQQNQATYQQNLAKYSQQVQENRASYQRQLMEEQRRKALGQQ